MRKLSRRRGQTSQHCPCDPGPGPPRPFPAKPGSEGQTPGKDSGSQRGWETHQPRGLGLRAEAGAWGQAALRGPGLACFGRVSRGVRGRATSAPLSPAPGCWFPPGPALSLDGALVRSRAQASVSPSVPRAVPGAVGDSRGCVGGLQCSRRAGGVAARGAAALTERGSLQSLGPTPRGTEARGWLLPPTEGRAGQAGPQVCPLAQTASPRPQALLRGAEEAVGTLPWVCKPRTPHPGV